MQIMASARCLPDAQQKRVAERCCHGLRIALPYRKRVKRNDLLPVRLDKLCGVELAKKISIAGRQARPVVGAGETGELIRAEYLAPRG